MWRRKRASISQDNKLLKTITKSNLFLALIALAGLCITAAAQNTADGWYKKAVALKALS